MHEIDAALAQMRNAWLAGRAASDAAPMAWREAIGNDELALVALAGHATDVLTRRAPGMALEERPLLPQLAAPLIPEALRARFRRLLASPKNAPSIERPLISFAAARNFVSHPADWMPDAKDDWAPEVYAPWLDWARAETAAAPNDDPLSIEAYEQWSWSERRKALAAMRAHDQAAARAIIAAKAGSEPAERRLRLIEALQTGLSEADAEYLESLAKDRSDRVQALARALLARLGRGPDTSELAAELAAMLELKQAGFIKRHKQLTIKQLKTSAQALRRRELFGLVPLASLATALGVSELELVTEPIAEGGIGEFADHVAATGSDGAVRVLLEYLLAKKDRLSASACVRLVDRLTATERKAVVPRIMAQDDDMFYTTLAIAGDSLGHAPIEALLVSPNCAALQPSVEASVQGADFGQERGAPMLHLLLPRIGLLLDAPSARSFLDQVIAWGLSPADPRLDMLHLNIALTPESAP